MFAGRRPTVRHRHRQTGLTARPGAPAGGRASLPTGTHFILTTLTGLAADGEGPGEISYVSAILPCGGDSILVIDPGLARATLFVGNSVVLGVEQDEMDLVSIVVYELIGG